MILKNATFYAAIVGIGATAVMASRMSTAPPVQPPPIEPSPKPYEISVAIGVPEASLVTRVHVQVWDYVQEGQPSRWMTAS